MDENNTCSKCGGNDFIAQYSARVECRFVDGRLVPYDPMSLWEFEVSNVRCSICGEEYVRKEEKQ